MFIDNVKARILSLLEATPYLTSPVTQNISAMVACHVDPTPDAYSGEIKLS
jgi:hypothetical protein